MKKITQFAIIFFIVLGFTTNLNAQAATPPCPTTHTDGSSYGILISSFSTTGGLTNISNTNSSGSVSDYRSQYVEIYEGTESTINFSATIGSQYWNRLQISLDTNSDGLFSEAEMLYGARTYGTNSGTLTIPGTLAAGDYNLRVLCSYNSSVYNDPCAFATSFPNSLGDIEDYTLRVSSVPSCGPATGLSATASSSQAADFSWNAGVSNDSYSWELFTGTDTSAAAVDSGSTTSTSDSTNATLSANTLYTIVLTGSCSGTPASSISTTFTTLCATVTSFPYAHGFEDLNCWTNSNASTAWALDSGDDYGPGSVTEGTSAVFFNDYDYNAGSTSDLMSPNLDLSYLTTARLSFDYHDGGDSDTVSVLVDDGSGAVVVYTTDATVDSWTTINVDLPDYAGQTVKIGFRGTSVYGYSNPHIDNLSVAEAPSCVSPTGITSSSISGTTATVSWTAASSNDSFAYVIYEGSDDSGTSVDSGTTTSNSINFTGLSAETTYYVVVTASCSGQSASSINTSFTTSCNAATAGFSQNFNGLSALPSCWEVTNGGGSNTWGMFNSQAIYIAYESAAHDDYLKSPSFTVTDGLTDGFSFQASSPDNSYPEQIDVIVEDLTNGTSTIIADDYTPSTTAGGVTYLSTFYDLSAYEGSDVRISFHSATQDMFRLYFDNFVVGSASSMAAGWAGFTSTSYSNAQNWYAGSVPTGDVTLNLNSDSASNSPTIASSVSASSLTVDTGVSLTISESGSLQTTGDFTNGGTVTMNSTATAHSSLIVGGSSTGSITYNRYADIDRWYITSSPVSGQDIDTFISNEDLAVSTNNSSLVALADYNNDGSQYAADPTITTGWWDYHQSGDDGTFTSGQGKIARLASDATDNLLGFTGTISGSVSVPMTVATTAFNLIGNPYPAAVQVTSQGGATSDVLSVNTSVLSEETAWFWNSAQGNGTGGYTAVNQNPSQAAKITAPGQGFFVSASGSGDFSFTTAMQTTSAGSFNRQTEWSKIDLSMSADSQSSETEIVYFDGATTGWDNGYDSTNWSSGSFQIFTSHVDTSTSQNLAIQSLPLGNFNDMVVPVGVNASAGQMITISVDTTNWPEGVKIYLEDVDNSSYTLLDGQNAEFTTLLDSNESGIGRFYIHTTSNSLGDEDLTLTDVSIYASSRDNLRILGINSGEANVQMFDLMGKQVLNTSFNGQSVNDVKLPNLNTGIYLVNLASDEGTVNKKIIIQ